MHACVFTVSLRKNIRDAYVYPYLHFQNACNAPSHLIQKPTYAKYKKKKKRKIKSQQPHLSAKKNFVCNQISSISAC